MNKKYILLSTPLIVMGLSCQDLEVEDGAHYESKSFPIVIKSKTLKDIFSNSLMGYDINPDMFSVERSDNFILINSKEGIRRIDDTAFDISYKLMLDSENNYIVRDGFLENENGYVSFSFDINRSDLSGINDVMELISKSKNISFDSYSEIANNYEFLSDYSEHMIVESFSFEKSGHDINIQNMSFTIENILDIKFVGEMNIADGIIISEGVLYYDIKDAELFNTLKESNFKIKAGENVIKIENISLDELIKKIIN